MSTFYLRPPARPSVPIVVSIPHTGTDVPAAIRSRLSAAARGLPMTDWHLHRLYDFLPAMGIHTIYARYSRYVVDLNRSPDGAQLYPGRFETGLVPLDSFAGEPNFTEPPKRADIEQLRQVYHAPYHRILGQLLAETAAQCGRVVLVDAHSVVSHANQIHGELTGDIYLGDRDGASCAGWLTETAADAFTDCGLHVSTNNPYKGGYITAHYGQREDVDALQIEMCQRLYMDENDLSRDTTQRFESMRHCLETVFTRIASALQRS